MNEQAFEMSLNIQVARLGKVAFQGERTERAKAGRCRRRPGGTSRWLPSEIRGCLWERHRT